MSNYLQFTKTLHITKPTLYGEWHNGPALLELIDKFCDNLRILDFTMAGSSSWCAYLPKIPQVTCVRGRSKDISETAAASFAEFRIDDLSNSFTNLQEVSLSGLQVCFNRKADTDPLPLPKLTTLSLNDCSWEYPSQIDDLGSVTDLRVVYSTHHFTHSERLRTFALSPPKTLKSLVIDIKSAYSDDNPTDVAWQPLLKHQCKGLVSLEVRGFNFPGEEFFLALPAALTKLKISCRSGKQLSTSSWLILKQHKRRNQSFSMLLNNELVRL
ncbi:hypothetical protein AWJ20_91 [Sugiyamaella lignohabitans]|uniref:Uncharacterized protein n=1 Tax=Sugiyamaella lignohabitans TaxID=796027 RepID=A0A167CLT1_9ASCO|nr:uncharacterized protein AWJ20_91 [Sugiyamaella lignohabitans]ANB11866.1 hypothetical protein AWJ20_91 [Sugiyamaella lignohabitans]